MRTHLRLSSGTGSPRGCERGRPHPLAWRAWWGLALLLCALPAAALRAQDRYEVAADGVRLQRHPSAHASILRRLPRGTEVVLLRDSSGWARVRVERLTGYVRRAQLVARAAAAIADAPVPTPSPAPAPDSRAAPGGATMAQAEAAGVRAGDDRSVAPVRLAGGVSSVLLPGSGFLGLLFLHRGEEGDVPVPDLHRPELRGHSSEYARAWTRAYDRTVTDRRRHALLVGSTIGSVAGIVAYRYLVFRGGASGAASSPPPPPHHGPKAARFGIVLHVP